MKMVLWVEDQVSSIQKVFNDKLDADREYQDLLENYHIHRVDNLDDALTAIQEHNYDYYLLDIEFPISADLDDMDGIENKEIIANMVGGDINNFNNMEAGQELFKYLLQFKNDVEQIRIYSAHIEQTKKLSEWYEKSDLKTLPWDEIVFDKSAEAAATAEEVREWLDRITTNRERILRHAMIEGCDEIVANEHDRSMYLRPSSDGICKPVDATKICNDVKLLRDIISITTHAEPNKSHQVYLLLMTKDCQEQLSFLNKQNAEMNPNIKLDEGFKRIATVLDRVRNMLAHNTTLNKDEDLTSFVAFVFLLYVRYLNSLSE